MRKSNVLKGLALSVCAVFLLSGCYQVSTGDPEIPTVASATVAENTIEETQTETTAEPESETETVTEEAETETETAEEETETAETEESGASMDVGAKWYVNADTLNVRSTPSTDGEIVAKIYRGFEVLILETSPDIDPWVRVMFQNDDGTSGEGYVSSTYLVNTKSQTQSSSDSSTAASADTSSAAAASTASTAAAATTAAAAATTAATTAAAATTASTTAAAATTAAVVTTTTTAAGASNGHIVCIDAGHQAYGISETEPNGPGSTVMKAKLTTGTSGVVTGVAERDLNLTIALKLQTELVNRGYQVVMIRTTNDCTLSNAERAQVANSSGAEVFLRIHANSNTDSSISGAQFYAPSPANPYMSADVIQASNNLANTMLNAYCAATGCANRGMLQDDTMTGINWCTIPVTIAEMGFMSNPTEDVLMEDPSYQALMVQGLANGLDAYFGL
ncbi:MAG: N-acetylmuramoyl-L-alanine amidase [Lachnospiraceae bacterium]|jgi:N-acetylmuramoyl-L-alanine amidase